VLSASTVERLATGTPSIAPDAAFLRLLLLLLVVSGFHYQFCCLYRRSAGRRLVPVGAGSAAAARGR